MRFLCLYKPARPEGTPPTAEEMTKMGELINEMTAARVLLATEGCQPSINGSRVRFEKGVFTVTDGPFTESKELVAGFALIDVASRAEAVQWTRRFLQVAGDGESEIRQLHEGGDCAGEPVQASAASARQ